MRLQVCQADEFEPGDRRIVETDRGIEVGVFNVGGEYHALLNVCPHQYGPVCEGAVVPRLEGEFVGIGKRVEQRYAPEMVVKCPWHGWEFEIATGENVGDEAVSLPTFDVAVEDGVVYVEL